MMTTQVDRPQERLVMDAGDIARAVTRIAHEILERNKGVEALGLVGIRTGGVHLAHRLVRRIHEIEAAAVPIGDLDITLYRDDLSLRKEQPIEGNVQLADRHRRRFNLLYPPHQPMGQMHPPGSNPHQRQIFYALVTFENFMGNAGHRPGDVSRIHHQPFLWSIDLCRHHRLILTA